MSLTSGRARQLSHAVPFVGLDARRFVLAWLGTRRAYGSVMRRRTRGTTVALCLAFASAAACGGRAASQQGSSPNPADTGTTAGGASGGFVATSPRGAPAGGGSGAPGNYGPPPGATCPETLPQDGTECFDPAEYAPYTCNYRVECATISAPCVHGFWELPESHVNCGAGGGVGFGGEAGIGGEAGGGIEAGDAGAAGQRTIEPAPLP